MAKTTGTAKADLTETERALLLRGLKHVGEFMAEDEVEPLWSLCEKVGLDPMGVPGLAIWRRNGCR